MGNLERALIIIIACFIFVTGISLISLQWLFNLKKEAVERGYAEWVVDSSGNTEWRWKEAGK